MVSATTQADNSSSTGLTAEPVTYTAMASGALAKVLSPAFQPAVFLARQACISLLARLDLPGASGVMEIIEKDGKQITLFGDPISKRSILKKEKSVKRKFTHATLNVKNEMFWIRLALGSDLGFAESYMLAEVETNDLGDCFKVSTGELYSAFDLLILFHSVPIRSYLYKIVKFFPIYPSDSSQKHHLTYKVFSIVDMQIPKVARYVISEHIMTSLIECTKLFLVRI